jgi:hypothetical protein
MATIRLGTFFVLILVYCTFLKLVMATGDASAIPDKFLGTFKLEKSENFDEFLSSKGVNWFVRKMIQMASITKIFQKFADKPNHYTAINLSSKENTKWEDWELNKSFEAKGLDGSKHRVGLFFVVNFLNVTIFIVQMNSTSNRSLMQKTFFRLLLVCLMKIL